MFLSQEEKINMSVCRLCTHHNEKIFFILETVDSSDFVLVYGSNKNITIPMISKKMLRNRFDVATSKTK